MGMHKINWEKLQKYLQDVTINPNDFVITGSRNDDILTIEYKHAPFKFIISSQKRGVDNDFFSASYTTFPSLQFEGNTGGYEVETMMSGFQTWIRNINGYLDDNDKPKVVLKSPYVPPPYLPPVAPTSKPKWFGFNIGGHVIRVSILKLITTAFAIIFTLVTGSYKIYDTGYQHGKDIGERGNEKIQELKNTVEYLQGQAQMFMAQRDGFQKSKLILDDSVESLNSFVHKNDSTIKMLQSTNTELSNKMKNLAAKLTQSRTQ
jgi:hypothetical protein